MGVIKEEIESVDFLGGIYVEMEEQYKAADYEPLMTQVQKDMEVDHAGFFQSQSDPNGAAWMPLAPSTIKRKGHSRILFDSGDLEASLISSGSGAVRETSHRGLLFGTSILYSGFHQNTRPHVGATEERADLVGEAVADQTVEELKVKT